jgi:hypothetical protein
LIPGVWLEEIFDGVKDKRKVYTDFLLTRLTYSDKFTKEANDAREALI